MLAFVGRPLPAHGCHERCGPLGSLITDLQPAPDHRATRTKVAWHGGRVSVPARFCRADYRAVGTVYAWSFDTSIPLAHHGKSAAKILCGCTRAGVVACGEVLLVEARSRNPVTIHLQRAGSRGAMDGACG